MRTRMHQAAATGRPWWRPFLGTALLLAPLAVAVAQEPAPAPAEPPPLAQAPAPAPAPAVAPEQNCAKIWLGREAEMEELVRTAKIVKIEDVRIGVMRPKRAFVEAGLPFSSIAWKSFRTGRYSGFWESYKSEIAGYELDKMLGLGMVPPTVERRVRGDLGAAILWVDNVTGWDMKADIRGPDPVAWARELVRLKMFDQLIGNVDRNQGNLLYDASYHLILIDHSRAFIEVDDLKKFQKFAFVDAVLWEEMQALTMETLEPVLGKWVSKGCLTALLKRRNLMKAEIDKLVAQRGQSVFLH